MEALEKGLETQKEKVRNITTSLQVLLKALAF